MGVEEDKPEGVVARVGWGWRGVLGCAIWAGVEYGDVGIGVEVGG